MDTNGLHAFRTYAALANSYPRLSVEEETALFLAWRDSGDVSSRDRLIQSNLRHVASIVWKFRSYSTVEELISCGNLGAVRALEKFDPERARFVTYMAYWTRAYIFQHILQTWSIVPGGPEKRPTMFFRLRREYRKLMSIHGDEERTIAEMSESLNIPVERLRRFVQIVHYSDLSTDAPIHEDGFSTLGDTLEAPEVKDHLDDADTIHIAQDALSVLDARERLIATEISSESASLSSLGRQLGISRERTRQLYSRALRKMRKRLAYLQDTSE